jgi:cytochrome c oxidase cbb3-type subunit 3
MTRAVLARALVAARSPAASARSATSSRRGPSPRRRASEHAARRGRAAAPDRADARPAHEVESNAFAVNQGKRLFRWYNCSGCHAPAAATWAAR